MPHSTSQRLQACIQAEALHCCGVSGSTDWANVRGTPPDSCCKESNTGSPVYLVAGSKVYSSPFESQHKGLPERHNGLCQGSCNDSRRSRHRRGLYYATWINLLMCIVPDDLVSAKRATPSNRGPATRNCTAFSGGMLAMFLNASGYMSPHRTGADESSREHCSAPTTRNKISNWQHVCLHTSHDEMCCNLQTIAANSKPGIIERN
ncbi:unnamed protein product [Timema podura]|uniref:Uncharacterized protein n=1 Tax=Timema podura TaxID=61482 RepID=A0ABN7P471_TIMPD|nr:unnamed protein product [Timema podura]